MARISATDLQKIVKLDVLTDENALAPFITMANVMVDESLANEGYSDALLFQIELNLAAHFASIRERRAASNESLTFEGKTGLGLDFTPYGQTAQMLDRNGALGRITKGTTAKPSIKAMP